MSQQFESNNQQSSPASSHTSFTTKELLKGIGSILVVALVIIYLIVKNNMIQKRQELESAYIQQEQDVMQQDMLADDSEVDRSVSSKVSSVQYAFDIKPDNGVFGLCSQLKATQDEAFKIYAYLESEGYEMPDWGCIMTDTFDLDSEGKVINYHTQNAFHAGWYETYIQEPDQNSQNSNSVISFGGGSESFRLGDIVNVDSGWFYELDEPTDVVLERLFAKDPSEDFYHFRSRMYDDGCLMFFDNINANVLSFFNADDSQLIVMRSSSRVGSTFDDEHRQRIPRQVEAGYTGLFSQNSDSEMFKKMCELADTYDKYRVDYLLKCIENIKIYVNEQAGYEPYENGA